MMNREALVERAAKAAWDADTEREGLSCYYDWQAPGGDVLNDGYRERARVILDAILPQVSTVAELEALPNTALLKSITGEVWQKSLPGWDCLSEDGTAGLYSSEAVASRGPLTIVWSPA